MATGNSDNQESSKRADLLVEVLKGAWRSSPPALSLSASDLSLITERLIEAGCGALAWWKIRHSELRSTPAALQLQNVYRFNSLQAGLFELNLKKAVALNRAVQVEPLLGKGLAVARYYPESGLRAYGDIDLYVKPDNYSKVARALKEAGFAEDEIDLHKGISELNDLDLDEVYKRAQSMTIDDIAAQVFSHEDHLRLLCIHTLKHGAWRPLWLCDIAATLEAKPANFDWDYFLRGDKKKSDWAACAIGLAHQMLGVDVEGTPVERRANNLPKWLIPTVRKDWATYQVAQGLRAPMKTYLRYPKNLFTALRLRWPNPIEATVDINGAFNNLPRLPFQLGDCIWRTARFLSQLPKQLRD